MAIIPDDRVTAVRAGMGARWSRTRIRMFSELGSTSQWLADHPPDTPTVVIADRQTKGRGRQGRKWASPPGGLYVSVGLPLASMQSIPPALSLLIGLQLVESLHARGFSGIQLKWPNDLVVDGAKLAGLLVERLPHTLIAGVGVNVEGSRVHDLPSDRQAIGLRQLSDQPIGDQLLGTLAGAVLEATTWSPSQAERLLRERWPVFDALAGRNIVVEQSGGTTLAGRVAGITTTGELRLITDFEERHLQAGECRVQGDWVTTR
ncbi:BirA family biotin operon repressor/biotin-[acetyl-CoA-carboxylase] ligase [Spiribacter vilamensis]|uniref:BirA family biotin operon repressor/biotin-[acetyl-CoA-carboxylase] ligase n=2 Tax=Spiribacter vilamensis TaxID=531306 RepID=A0A4Q8D303_9GAMM|nr:BirA family biotin operon repressor/biotin-[acetyl-CoA-carboxylase] ligase [Spiribacter vilamensis]